MNYRESKSIRALSIYFRLCDGRIINKSEEAIRFGVDERSIQRDIDDIRAFLDDKAVSGSNDIRRIVYNRKKNGYIMQGGRPSLMSNHEILAVSKILLESRAFTKGEISEILDKLIAGCVPEKNMKMVSDLLANEKYHYVGLRHKKRLKELIWDLGEDIKKLRRVEIKYEKMSKEKNGKKQSYIVEPVGLLFSEYYFYLNAFIDEKLENGQYGHKYQYPAIFRLDRIISRRETGETFKVAYSNRFEEGEFRKRVQFMYAGTLLRIRFKYYGLSVDAVLDRLPTAKVIETNEDYALIEAEVYGKGIVMWILSQGKNIEVLFPKSLRQDIKKTLDEMMELYLE